MTLEELEKAIEECYTKRPLGATIRTQEDLDTIKRIAAALKEHGKPLHIRHMKWLLELTSTILESALLHDVNL